MTNPLNLISLAKAHLVEQIMALIGRASPNPKRYRELLEDRDIETLRRMRDHILDGVRPWAQEGDLLDALESLPGACNDHVSAPETGALLTFPAPTEALNHSAEANSRAPNGDGGNSARSELSARDTLTLKSFWVIYNTRLNKYAASDIDWKELCDTTLHFLSEEAAKEFVQFFSDCFWMPDIRIENAIRVSLQPETTGP